MTRMRVGMGVDTDWYPLPKVNLKSDSERLVPEVVGVIRVVVNAGFEAEVTGGDG